MEVKVRHLIEYLQRFNPELPVHLDKDGWLVDEINATDEVDLVDQRGIFDYYNGRGTQFLTINN